MNKVAMDIKQEHYFNGRRCRYVPETVDGTKSGWFLALHGENTEQYENYSCVLAVTQVHSGSGNQASGIMSLNIRINNYTMSIADWRMICGNLSADKFRLVCNSYTDFYVYAKTTDSWDKYMFEVLSESRENISTYSPIFKFNSSSTPISGDPNGTSPRGAEQITFDMVYPIGSIYMSVNSTNPKNLFGGTWEQIKDRFLLSAGSTYAAGKTGGSSTHKLTSSEMPSHSHQMNKSTEQRWSSSDGTWANFRCGTSSMIGGDIYTQSTGGGNAHNNMPPYLVVYVWKRTG